MLHPDIRQSMQLFFGILLTLNIRLFANPAILAAETSCAFQNFQGNCGLVLPRSALHVSIFYVLNYCSKPQDITFKVLNLNTSEKYQHSFANADEMQPVAALSNNVPVQLRVQLSYPMSHVMQVQAMLYEAGETSGNIVNQYMHLDKHNDCSTDGTLMDLLPLILFVALLVLVGILGPILIYIRVKHLRKKPNPDHLLEEEDSLSLGPDHTPCWTSNNVSNPYTSTTVINNHAFVNTVTEHVARKSRKHRRKHKRPTEDANTLIVNGRTVYKKVDITDEV